MCPEKFAGVNSPLRILPLPHEVKRRKSAACYVRIGNDDGKNTLRFGSSEYAAANWTRWPPQRVHADRMNGASWPHEWNIVTGVNGAQPPHRSRWRGGAPTRMQSSACLVGALAILDSRPISYRIMSNEANEVEPPCWFISATRLIMKTTCISFPAH